MTELVFAAVGAISLLHAASRPAGPPRQHYLLLWVSSLLGGLSNDVFFSWLPLVDNFWHAFDGVDRLPSENRVRIFQSAFLNVTRIGMRDFIRL